jgi:acetylornithine deacetylase
MPSLPDPGLLRELDSALRNRRNWAIERLDEWVRRASTLGSEAAAQDYAAGLFEEVGFQARVLPVDVDRISKLPGFSPVDWSYDDRPNVVGVHRVARQEGRSLVFNGHVDVVSAEPVKLWTTPPFEPAMFEEGGESWMTGRGAGDMKGGSMCFLWALMSLHDLGYAPASDVVLQSPIEEECTGNGALDLLARGYTADACVIPEPFGETVLASQLGVVWFQVRVLGRTTHVLGAGRGVNAIEKSWLFIDALRRLEVELNRPELRPTAYAEVDHPINLNVGTIQGGDWASTVAGECVTRFRLALYPGQSLAALREWVENVVAETARADPWLREFPPTVEWIGFQAEGCTFDTGGAFGTTLRTIHERLRGVEPGILNATCTTDVRFFNLYHGIPATCYGPAARNIHGVDECVSIDSMERVAQVFTHLVAEWCGAQKRSKR